MRDIPATPADSEFCYQLHKAAMGSYVTAIWGWDDQVQHDFHVRAFSPGHWQIITAGQADIGMKEVARHGDNNIKITMRLTHNPVSPSNT